MVSRGWWEVRHTCTQTDVSCGSFSRRRDRAATSKSGRLKATSRNTPSADIAESQPPSWQKRKIRTLTTIMQTPLFSFSKLIFQCSQEPAALTDAQEGCHGIGKASSVIFVCFLTPLHHNGHTKYRFPVTHTCIYDHTRALKSLCCGQSDITESQHPNVTTNETQTTNSIML